MRTQTISKSRYLPCKKISEMIIHITAAKLNQSQNCFFFRIIVTAGTFTRFSIFGNGLFNSGASLTHTRTPNKNNRTRNEQVSLCGSRVVEAFRSGPNRFLLPSSEQILLSANSRRTAINLFSFFLLFVLSPLDTSSCALRLVNFHELKLEVSAVSTSAHLALQKKHKKYIHIKIYQ